MSGFLILGCGYTGRRVAALLAAAGHPVWATSREPAALSLPGVTLLPLNLPHHAGPLPVPAGVSVLHSVPLLDPPADPTPLLLAALNGRARRIVYLSTTGVYGPQFHIDEHTLPAPNTLRQRLRVDAEQLVLRGPWSSLVLRPAAIYGPGRGVHEAIREGRFRLLGDGSNWVSRIHVDDLAAIAVAALTGTLSGAWPVADEHPCPSHEIAHFCAALLGVSPPPSAPPIELSETRLANRKVDGRAVLAQLKVRLRFPSYQLGIPASFVGDFRPNRTPPPGVLDKFPD